MCVPGHDMEHWLCKAANSLSQAGLWVNLMCNSPQHSCRHYVMSILTHHPLSVMKIIVIGNAPSPQKTSKTSSSTKQSKKKSWSSHTQPSTTWLLHPYIESRSALHPSFKSLHFWGQSVHCVGSCSLELSPL